MPNQNSIDMDNATMNRLENSLRSIVDTVMSKIQGEKALKTVGEMGALAGAGYGVYKFANTPVGQSAVNTAGQYAQAGMTRMEDQYQRGKIITSPRDAYGRFYSPGIKASKVSSQIINNTAAGTIGAGTAGLSTAATLGGGALLTKMGITGAVSTGASAVGKTVGAFGASAPIRLAGMGASNLVGGIPGMSGAASAISGMTETLAGGAAKGGSLVGGLAGGLAPALAGGYIISKSTDSVVNNLTSQTAAERQIGAASFRFTPGMATDMVTGRGLGYTERAELAERAREDLVDERFIRQNDFSEIFQGIMENDLLYNVRGAEQFQDKFEKVTKSLKDIAQIYGSTLGEATEMLGEVQRSGFYTVADQSTAVLNADAIGRMTGYTGKEVIQMGQRGAQTARQFGMGGQLGHQVTSGLLLGYNERLDQLSQNPYQQQRIHELTQEIGGREEAMQKSTQFMMQTANRTKVKQAMFGLLDPETGEFDDELLNQYMSGNMDFTEAVSRGSRMASQNQEWYEEFRNNANQYYEEMTGTQFNKFMSQTFEGYQETMGFEDMESVLNELGMKNPKVRKFFEELLEGAEQISQSQIELRRVNEQMRKDQILRRTPAGIFEHVKHFGEQVGYGLSRPFVQGFQAIKDTGRDVRNWMLGLDEVETDTRNVDVNADLNNQSILQQLGYDEGQLKITGLNDASDKEVAKHIRKKQRNILKDISGNYTFGKSAEDLNLAGSFGDKAYTNVLKGALTAMNKNEDINSLEDLKVGHALPKSEYEKLGLTGSESLLSFLEQNPEYSEQQIEMMRGVTSEFNRERNRNQKILNRTVNVDDEMKELFNIEENRISINDFMGEYGNIDNLSKKQQDYINRFKKRHNVGQYTGTYEDYLSAINEMTELGGIENAKEQQRIISENIMKPYMGKYIAEDEFGVANDLKRFDRTEGSLVDKFSSLYSEDLIQSLDEDDPLRTLLNIGKDATIDPDKTLEIVGDFEAAEGKMGALKEAKKTMEQAKGKDRVHYEQSKEQFQKLVNQIVTERFVKSEGVEGVETLTPGASAQDYAKQYQENMINEAVNNSNQALTEVNQTIRDIPFDDLNNLLSKNNETLNKVKEELANDWF